MNTILSEIMMFKRINLRFFLLLMMMLSAELANSSWQMTVGDLVYRGGWTGDQSKDVYVSRLSNKEYAGSLVIPATVKIGGYVYNVTSIDRYAFMDCKNITSVSIPGSIKWAIHESAFNGCEKLVEVTIADGVPVIEKYAFAGCTSLERVDIPNSVTSIGPDAFANCTKLPEIDLPDNLKEISGSTFENCTSLTSITIPNSVTDIYGDAFKGCSSLISVNFANNSLLTTIWDEAFSSCSKLPSISIPKSVTSIGTWAFLNCISLNEVIFPSNSSLVKIENGAFRGCSGLLSINLPNGISHLGSTAFYDCSSLPSINIPNSINRINDNTFQNCSSLISVQIPNSVDFIGESAFKNCTKLPEIDLPDNLKKIQSYTFKGCTSLISIIIPNSVTDIGYCAFEDCSQLPSIIIPDGVISIKNYAFNGCCNLSSVSLGKEITSIYEYAFSGCEKLEEVTFYCNSILRYSGWPQQKCCNSIKKVIIGEGVETIGEYAFSAGSGISGLETIIFANPTLKKIGEKAFYECKSLKYAFNEGSVQPSEGTIILPEPLESIGLNAFWISPGIKIISLPSSLTFIDNLAFYGNNSEIGVEDVYAHMHEPFKINESVFNENTYKNAILHTDGVADKYRETFAWSKFFHVVNYDEAAGYGDGGSDSENHGNSGHAGQLDEIIDFADPQVKMICVEKWDTSKDGKLSKREAAAVTSLGIAFKGTDITSFNELKHFTGLTKIDNWAFGNCTNLLFVILPEQVTEIGMNAFTNCTALTAMTIPALVATIGESAFAGCKSLMAFNVDTQNEKFATEGGILYNKEKTTLISCPAGKFATATLPESVLKIEANGFYNCVNLPAIILPASLQKIGAASFVGCSSLTSLDIPASTSKIEIGNFTGCTNLETINVEADNQYYQSIDGVLYTKDGKTLMAYPNKKGTTYIVLEGTETIEAYAFCMTEVENLTLPASVQNVDDYALGLCNKLSRLKVKAVTPSEASSSSFVGTLSSVMLILPCGSKDAYQIANGWKIFTNIVVLGDANGDGDVNQGDISLVKNYIMTGVEPQGFKWYGADVDENDEINVADIVMIVNLIKSMVK